MKPIRHMSRFIPALALTILGCSRVEPPITLTEVGANSVLDKKGVYAIRDSNVVVAIWRDDNLLAYKVHRNGRKVIESQGDASIFSRYALQWDGTRLWVYSGDIGAYVWHEVDGVFVYEGVTDSLSPSMPSEIRSAM